MDTSRFNGKSGKLVRRSATFGREFIEFDYFSPKQLPKINEFCKDMSLMEKSNEANRHLGKLQGLVKNIGSLNLFTDAYMRKEAVDSSEIEGTFVSLTDVFLSEAGSKKPNLSNPNVVEVVNFVDSLEYSIKQLKSGKNIDEELINTMHKFLLEKARGQEKLVGEYRKQPNWIKSKGATKDILDADFVPPSEEEIKRLMDYLFDYLSEKDGFMRLIKAGLIHYYFETIHPYEDGNGRLGRALILLYFIKSKVLEEPILYLSPYFKKHKEVYYSLLMEVREKGNYVKWIKFFLDGITETSINTSKKVERLIELYNEYKNKLTKLRATPISYLILDKFFEKPYFYITHLQEELKESNYPKIKRGIKYLVECGAIREFTSQRRNKIFYAPEILNILEEDLF